VRGDAKTTGGRPGVNQRLAIMITTHNRLIELKRTIGVLRCLDPQPDELLITADGCNDETEKWVREQVPEARLFVNQPGRGSISSRDTMMCESSCELVLSLDDDSYPIEADAIGRLKNWFSEHEQVGVATFPLVTEEYPESLQQEGFEGQGYSATFPNCAACFSRRVYRQLPGFPALFFHVYEEPDYGLQCINAGFSLIHTNVITVRHHWTPLGRNEIKIHHRHARNELWSTVLRTPFPWAIGVVAYRIFSQFRYACRRGIGWVIREPIWWWHAARGIRFCFCNRQIVSWQRYKAWLSLLRQPTTDEATWRQLMQSGTDE